MERKGNVLEVVEKCAATTQHSEGWARAGSFMLTIRVQGVKTSFSAW